MKEVGLKIYPDQTDKQTIEEVYNMSRISMSQFEVKG
jgi:hypothetical protein